MNIQEIAEKALEAQEKELVLMLMVSDKDFFNRYTIKKYPIEINKVDEGYSCSQNLVFCEDIEPDIDTETSPFITIGDTRPTASLNVLLRVDELQSS
jgi:hypothetical protein